MISKLYRYIYISELKSTKSRNGCVSLQKINTKVKVR